MTRTCTESTLRDVIEKHGGHLIAGCGTEDGAVCILQAKSLCLGLPMTDDPAATNMPDIRRLNDARWSSDAVRTEHMIRLAVAFAEWGVWTRERKIYVVTKIAILTVNRIIAELPSLTDEQRSQCRAAKTRDEAQSAAAAAAAARWAAGAAAADADAARWAADAARWAADAAAARWAAGAAAAAARWADAAADKVLTVAVDLWIEATQ